MSLTEIPENTAQYTEMIFLNCTVQTSKTGLERNPI